MDLATITLLHQLRMHPVKDIIRAERDSASSFLSRLKGAFQGNSLTEAMALLSGEADNVQAYLKLRGRVGKFYDTSLDYLGNARTKINDLSLDAHNIENRHVLDLDSMLQQAESRLTRVGSAEEVKILERQRDSLRRQIKSLLGDAMGYRRKASTIHKVMAVHRHEMNRKAMQPPFNDFPDIFELYDHNVDAIFEGIDALYRR